MEFDKTFEEFKREVLSIDPCLETILWEDMEIIDPRRTLTTRNVNYWIIYSLVKDSLTVTSVSQFILHHNSIYLRKIELTPERTKMFVQLLETFKSWIIEVYDSLYPRDVWHLARPSRAKKQTN